MKYNPLTTYLQHIHIYSAMHNTNHPKILTFFLHFTLKNIKIIQDEPVPTDKEDVFICMKTHHQIENVFTNVSVFSRPNLGHCSRRGASLRLICRLADFSPLLCMGYTTHALCMIHACPSLFSRQKLHR
jgi:hypothetical protein